MSVFLRRLPLRFITALLVFVLLGLGQEANAQGKRKPGHRAGGPVAGKRVAARKAPQAGRVAVRLMVVAATDSHDRTDPSLGPLLKHLQFLRYRGYELLDTHRAEVALNGRVAFAIQGDRKVALTLLSRSPERVQFRVQVHRKGGKLLDTTLTVNRNGTFIVAGPRYRDGILILPLTVKY
jgi:hypothetical protein